MSWTVSRDEDGDILVEADYVHLSDEEAREFVRAVLDVADRRAGYVDGWGGREDVSPADEGAECSAQGVDVPLGVLGKAGDAAAVAAVQDLADRHDGI